MLLLQGEGSLLARVHQVVLLPQMANRAGVGLLQGMNAVPVR